MPRQDVGETRIRSKCTAPRYYLHLFNFGEAPTPRQRHSQGKPETPTRKPASTRGQPTKTEAGKRRSHVLERTPSPAVQFDRPPNETFLPTGMISHECTLGTFLATVVRHHTQPRFTHDPAMNRYLPLRTPNAWAPLPGRHIKRTFSGDNFITAGRTTNSTMHYRRNYFSLILSIATSYTIQECSLTRNCGVVGNNK